MNENIDLTKILKDCPKGWRLYSSVYGELIYSGMYISSSASKIYFEDQNCKSLISGSRVTVEYYRDGTVCTKFYEAPCKSISIGKYERPKRVMSEEQIEKMQKARAKSKDTSQI